MACDQMADQSGPQVRYLKVSQAEWQAYIDAYPRPLQTRTVNWCLPSVREYADSTISRQWARGTVAYVVLNQDIGELENQYHVRVGRDFLCRLRPWYPRS